jgi:hypothetical protein
VVVTTPSRLIDHIRRDNVDVSDVSMCLLCPPGDEAIGQFSADLQFIYAKFERQPTTVLIRGQEITDTGTVEELMRRPARLELHAAHGRAPQDREPEQEQEQMADKRLPFDAESTAQQLRDIVRRIHEDEDPAELIAYKRFIKKHVSVFNRAYFTAYLFKQSLGGQSTSSHDRTSIFVSAGRNRRIHARDLVTLFTSADGVSRDDIGQIKVLDNYSFVELEASKAKDAIEKLNGTELRGKKLTVNYARRK